MLPECGREESFFFSFFRANQTKLCRPPVVFTDQGNTHTGSPVKYIVRCVSSYNQPLGCEMARTFVNLAERAFTDEYSTRGDEVHRGGRGGISTHYDSVRRWEEGPMVIWEGSRR